MNRSCGLWDPFRAHNPQACHRKGTVFRSIQPVLSVMRASWRPHTLYFAASGVGAAASLALPVLLDRAIESAFDDHRAAATTGWTVAALAAALLATVVASRAKNASVAAAGAQLRRSLIQQVLDAGLPATQRFRTGDLLARITGNVTVASDMGFALINCVMAALSALGAMLALLYLDWTLALAYAAGAGATAVILWRSTKSATTVYERYQSVQASIVSALDDALTGLGTIHAAGTQERELARITEPLKDLSAVGRRDWAVMRQDRHPHEPAHGPDRALRARPVRWRGDRGAAPGRDARRCRRLSGIRTAVARPVVRHHALRPHDRRMAACARGGRAARQARCGRGHGQAVRPGRRGSRDRAVPGERPVRRQRRA